MLATQKGRSKPVRISCRRSEKVKRGSRPRFVATAVLRAQPSPHFVRRQSRNSNDFVTAGLAGRYGNGRTRYIQKICEEFDARFVGSTIDRRCGQSQFQRIAQFAHDSVLLRAWVYL